MFIKIKDKFFNDYIKKISFLITGSFFSQLITFLFLTILSRIYTAEDFGIYTTFLTLSGSIALISSLTYHRAIVLPKSNNDSFHILILSIFLCIITTLFVLFGCIYFANFLVIYFGNFTYIIYLIPLRVFQHGMQLIFDEFSIRNEFYALLSFLKPSNSLLTSIFQLLPKILYKFDSLIWGKQLADTFILMALISIHLYRKTFQFGTQNIKIFKNVIKRYIYFPKYYLPQISFNTISQALPFILLPYFFSIEAAGVYGMAIRALEQPIRLIATSTQSVYYQKASKMVAKGENILNLYIKTSNGLFKIFIVPAIIIFIFGQEIFGFVFGSQWYESGQVAQILIIWLLIGFAKTPSTMTYSIFNLQKVQLVGESLLLFFRFLSIIFGYLFYNSFIISITLYVIVSIFVDLFFIFYIYNYLKKNA